MMPRLSIKTWLIIGLGLALAVVLLAVPTTRRALAAVLVAVGTWLGAKQTEKKAASDQNSSNTPDDNAPEPTTAADDLSQETEQAVEDEHTAEGDELYDDWQELADE